MDQKDIRQRETEGQETAVLLKRLRVSAVFHALLVLLGAFVTQFVASMLCMIVTGVYVLFVQGRTREDLSKLLIGSLGDYSMIISLVYAVGAIVWCGILYYRWTWRERPFSYRKAFEGARIPCAIALGFGACMVFNVIVSAAATLFPDAFVSYQKLMGNLDFRASILTVPYVMLAGGGGTDLSRRDLRPLKAGISVLGCQCYAGSTFWVFPSECDPGPVRFCSWYFTGNGCEGDRKYHRLDDHTYYI